MKKTIAKIALLALLIVPLAGALPVKAAALPNWNVVGTYQWLVLGTYAHDLVITVQNPDGTFSGIGGYPAGSSPYTAAGQTPEMITGQVTGDAITLTTTYTGPLNPGYSVTVTGTIAPDGSMNGVDPFEWHTTSGNAVAISHKGDKNENEGIENEHSGNVAGGDHGDKNEQDHHVVITGNSHVGNSGNHKKDH